MSQFDTYLSSMPMGQRIGGSASNALSIKKRKFAVARAILLASLGGEVLLQKVNLNTLAECEELKSTRGLGDFLGNGKGGLQLTLVKEGNDWRIDPSPWHAWKAWRWIKAHAEEKIENLIIDYDLRSQSELEDRIMAAIEALKTVEPTTVNPA